MAPSSSEQYFSEDDDLDDSEEEEFEHFDDFTLASSWERFISEIEAVCRHWLADGPETLLEKNADCLEISKNLYKVKSELKYLTKSYCMEYYFVNGGDGGSGHWNSNLHDLQLSFGVKEFLVIAPQSASGVVLDAPEASKLLSAVAIALSNSSSLWPAFVPVHIPSRKAFIGIQNMGTVFTRRFESDRIGSQVPVKLMHLEGLYELFISKFVFSTLDLSMHLFKVNFTMKLTYQTILHDDDSEVEGANVEVYNFDASSGGEMHRKAQWDEDCPWSEWYSAEDPVKDFELIVIWNEKTIESSLEMAELENASLHEAEKWIISPTFSPNIIGNSVGNIVGFASQLHLLVKALNISFGAKYVEDYVSVESLRSDGTRSSAVIPPPTVLDRVLKDIFNEGKRVNFSDGEDKTSRNIKGAPLESLFAQFCLHSLWFGDCNIRAIAVLWIEFVREVRWCWEESQPLPRMLGSGVIDLSTCLVNQKLQMLAICIEKKLQQDKENEDGVESEESVSAHAEDGSTIGSESSHSPRSGNFNRERDSSSSTALPVADTKSHRVVTSASLEPTDSARSGSAGIVGSMMLLNSRQYMHAPFTQDAPIMTEDMHEERLQAAEAFGNFSFSAQLERDVLLSDMSAFKAANPDAIFEDFIRWHSPKDWEDEDTLDGGDAKDHSETKWPPRGRLSARMSDNSNSWRKIWNEAPALSVSNQKPLLDPNREGEKVLHYLETISPYQLLEQMVCTAFKAAADTLHQTTFGNLQNMKTKLGQLYLTMASFLKPLQANLITADSKFIEDMRRLCVIFEHIEKLLYVAASLHRKFVQAPHLSEAIFCDFFSTYLPKMGTGTVEADITKGFEKKQEVNMADREVVASLFSPPNANQSWRKVLSMGNLLNGHEPILREIRFSLRDRMNGSYYAASTPWGHDQEIETYRMYICGSSNDLQVALSVASCD
ncbi:Rab3 GTPase-activating protein catalytic subunit [Heracleum sosnowskyi]|uniref:Rab3 GTPase-activating protein catalytic subunit n=1 Tax=Heracleum sosnowskyi TaxID=360622 RepID=A0AAD8J6K2_9APIA|nr:Rab3 GTPase-activating protein catalytic subunit [Heracleum sosnowskyi]